MYSIILLILMAQVAIASDHRMGAQGSSSSGSNAELDAVLCELELLPMPQETAGAERSRAASQSQNKTQKSNRRNQLSAMIEAIQHTCSPSTCVKKVCPSRNSVSDQEWEDEVVTGEGMYNVEHCDVSSNYLISLPSINDPSQTLTILDLSDNKLRTVPYLGALAALKHLSFKCNLINHLDLKKFPKDCLNHMDFENNTITTIAPIDDWRMESNSINRIELAGNPLTRACLTQLAIAGPGSVFFLGLRGARKGFTHSGSIVGITPDEVRAIFSQSKGGAIELGRFNTGYDEELNELRKCINPGKKSIIKGGIRAIGHFCNDKSIQGLLPKFPYFTESAQPLALTSSSSASLRQFHDISDMRNDVTSSASAVMSIDRILSSIGEEFELNTDTDIAQSTSDVMCIGNILNSEDEKSEELAFNTQSTRSVLSVRDMLNSEDVQPEEFERVSKESVRAEKSEEAWDPKKRKAQRHTAQKYTTQKRIRKNTQGSNSLVASFALTDEASSIPESVEQLRLVIMSGSNSTSIPSSVIQFNDQSKTFEPVNARIVSINDILNSEDVQPGRDDFGDRFLSDVDNNSSDSTRNRIN